MGVLLAGILVAGLIERMIPLDFLVPGIRLGLSNVVILTALYILRTRLVFVLTILKCVLLAAVAGGMSSFFYGLSGSILSFTVMALLLRIPGDRIGSVGVSVCGAVAHITGQLLMACLILSTADILMLAPPLVVLSAVTGVLVGVSVHQLRKHLRGPLLPPSGTSSGSSSGR